MRIIKLLQPLALPSSLIALGLVIGVFALIRSHNRLGKRLIAAVAAAYVLFSSQSMSYVLLWPLERKFSQPLEAGYGRELEAIVVLAGATDLAEGLRPRAELNGASWRRLWRGIEIYREFHGRLPLIYSGGSMDETYGTAVEAALVERLAMLWGIPPGQILFDNGSRNTYESGLAVRALLNRMHPTRRSHDVALITSAWHMSRASAVFRKLGYRVVPEACDFRSNRPGRGLEALVPNAGAFTTSTLAVQEWLSLAVYAATGRI